MIAANIETGAIKKGPDPSRPSPHTADLAPVRIFPQMSFMKLIGQRELGSAAPITQKIPRTKFRFQSTLPLGDRPEIHVRPGSSRTEELLSAAGYGSFALSATRSRIKADQVLKCRTHRMEPCKFDC